MNIETKLALIRLCLMDAMSAMFDCRRFAPFRASGQLYDVTCYIQRLRRQLIANAHRHAQRAVAATLKALVLMRA